MITHRKISGYHNFVFKYCEFCGTLVRFTLEILKFHLFAITGVLEYMICQITCSFILKRLKGSPIKSAIVIHDVKLKLLP